MKITDDRNLKKVSYLVRTNSIPTRFFFAPINTGFSENGHPLNEMFDFYEERSGKEVGINYVGNVAIGPDYVTNNNTAYFKENLSEWKTLANTIIKKGSLPGIQIACRNSSITPIRKMINKDKETYISTVQNEIICISKEEIYNIIYFFVESIEKAYNAGFKVIQIHSAHGYFLSQLLNEQLNVRKDEFGLNKLKALKEIVSRVRNKLPNDLIIDIRISLIEGLFEEEKELMAKHKIINELVEMDIDMISISNGLYDINKQLIYPLKKWGHGVFVEKIAPYARSFPHLIWNASGNIWDIDKLELEKLPNNLTFSTA